MAYAHGSVVLAPASHKTGARPYLVVSNSRRPFFGDEYTVAVVTSRRRDSAIELKPESLSEGELKKYPSFVNPWSLHVFRHSDVIKRVAQVDTDSMEDVAQAVYRMISPDDSISP